MEQGAQELDGFPGGPDEQPEERDVALVGEMAAAFRAIEGDERPDRPPPCRRCRGPSWWNGWRVVFPVVAALVAGVLERWELPLPRAKCSRCRHGFTCYPNGIFPRRQYQLDVVAGVVAQVAPRVRIV